MCKLPGFETSTPEEQRKALQKICREYFLTDTGKIILNMLLEDLCFFSAATEEYQKNLCNYAKFFISDRLGIKDTMSVSDALIETVRNKEIV